MRTLHREGPPGHEGVSAVIPADTSSEGFAASEQQKASKAGSSARSDSYADTDDANTDRTSTTSTSTTATGETEPEWQRPRFEPHVPSPNQYRHHSGHLEGLPENEPVLKGLPNDEDLDEFVGGSTSALDCTDRSVTDTWATLRTLNASSRNHLDLLGLGTSSPDEDGLDFIAP